MSIYYKQALHNVIVRDQGFGKSSNDKPLFWMTFDVEDEIQPDGTAQPVPNRYERTTRLYFSDAAKDRSVEILRGLGFTGDSFRDLEPGGGFSFIGRIIQVDCQHDEYEGKQHEKWELPYKSNSPEQTEGIARDLDALFGADLRSTAKKAAPKLEPKPDTSTGEVASPPVDDVPF